MRVPRLPGFTDFSRNEGIKPRKREKSFAIDADPLTYRQTPAQNLSREIAAARLRQGSGLPGHRPGIGPDPLLRN